jgi:hypothetical protein
VFLSINDLNLNLLVNYEKNWMEQVDCATSFKFSGTFSSSEESTKNKVIPGDRRMLKL